MKWCRLATYRVHGAAWGGEDEIAKVEISADGGATWSAAKLLDDPIEKCLAILGVSLGDARRNRPGAL